MPAEYRTVTWGGDCVADCRRLVKLALGEDLRDEGDVTTRALAESNTEGRAQVVSREPGVLAGGVVVEIVLEEAGAGVRWTTRVEDGTPLQAGSVIGELTGSAADILSAERVLLNLMGRLSGIASLTKRFVGEVQGTEAQVYDTRKTTPGWRLLEKYAVHCGGGRNHRTGLYDAILIKDNHLAVIGQQQMSLVEAVERSRERYPDKVLEIEVDTLEQLKEVLPAGPDIVLLDNMSLDSLSRAVSLRDELGPGVVLEASGGVRLETINGIARTGVDRISVGAVTHSARSLDLGLDWV